MASLNDNDAVAVALLLSEQEASFGTNMFDSLTVADDVEMDRLRSAGLSTHDAALSIFQRKYRVVSNLPSSILSSSSVSPPSVHSGYNGNGSTSRYSLGRESLSPPEESVSARYSPPQQQQQQQQQAPVVERAANRSSSRLSFGSRFSSSPPDNDSISVGDGQSVSSRTGQSNKQRERSMESNNNNNSRKTFFQRAFFPFTSSSSRSQESIGSPNSNSSDSGERRSGVSAERKSSSGSPPYDNNRGALENDISTLIALGFSRDQSIDSLRSNNYDVKKAALVLLSRT